METNITILHLIDSGGLYGAENVILNLSACLNKKGQKNIIGCFVYNGKSKPDIGLKAEELGLDVAFFKMKNKIDLTCIKNIAKYCTFNGINLIHSHGYKASLFCLLLHLLYGLPYVVTCHLWFSQNLKLKIYAFLEKLCMLKAAAVIGVSQDIVNTLRKGGIPSKKLFLIYNGIDVGAISICPAISDYELRSRLSLRQNSFIIGSLGRLTEQKDYKTLIRAASEALKEEHDLEFIVAGEGHLRNELVSFTKELGIDDRFRFLGFQQDVCSLLYLMDIFVLTSLDEGLPMALLEAMAAKCPVVTTPVGAIPTVINNGINGMIFKKQDVMNLKDILLTLKRDADKRKMLSCNAFDLVKSKFSNDLMASKYLNIYEDIMVQGVP